MKMTLDSGMTPEEYTRNGQNIPKKPKPGEPIICQYCNQIIYPSEFSKDSFQRKFEFKWHLHPWCKEAMMSQADRGTPGLVEERKRAAKRLEENEETQTNLDTKSKAATSRNSVRTRQFGQKI